MESAQILSGFRDCNVSAEILDKHCSSSAHDEAFEFWRNEWGLAIAEQELAGLSVEASDKFVNADEVLVVRDTCLTGSPIVALALVNHINLQRRAHHHVAYLKALPADGRALLAARRVQRILASGYNIVTQSHRRTKVGQTPLSLILPGLALALFEQRPEFDLCIGMPLTASGNHRTLERLGMSDMHSGTFLIHNVRAKFMYVAREDVNLGPYGHDIRGLLRGSNTSRDRHGIPITYSSQSL